MKKIKWHAHVAYMAKHMNMVGAPFGGGSGPLGPTPKSGAEQRFHHSSKL